ncbi:MAG: hypothetical protein ACR2JC_17640 [Chloroflexota bacterium]
MLIPTNTAYFKGRLEAQRETFQHQIVSEIADGPIRRERLEALPAAITPVDDIGTKQS